MPKNPAEPTGRPEPSRERPPSPAAIPDSSTAPETQAGIVAAVQAEFARRMQQARGQFQQRYAEQYVAHGNAVAAAQRDIQETSAKAFHRYREDLTQAWGPSDLADRVTAAYQRSSGLLEELSGQGNMQSAAQQAYANFANGLGTLGTGDANEAHANYVRALERVLAQTETRKRAAEAYAEYLLLLRQLQQDRWQRTYDAFSAYQRTVNDSPESTGFAKRIDAALESSMTAMRQAWEEMYQEYNEASVDALKALQTTRSAGSGLRSS
jgi:hypothetical protein